MVLIRWIMSSSSFTLDRLKTNLRPCPPHQQAPSASIAQTLHPQLQVLLLIRLASWRERPPEVVQILWLGITRCHPILQDLPVRLFRLLLLQGDGRPLIE